MTQENDIFQLGDESGKYLSTSMLVGSAMESSQSNK